MGARCSLPSTAWLKLRALDELVPGADVYTGIGPAEGGRKASLHGFAEPPGILEEGPIWTVGRDRTASIGGPLDFHRTQSTFFAPCQGLTRREPDDPHSRGNGDAPTRPEGSQSGSLTDWRSSPNVAINCRA